MKSILIKDTTREERIKIPEVAGAETDNVVKTTVLLAGINDFGAMNEAYKTCFAEPLPARAAFQTAKLPSALCTISIFPVLNKNVCKWIDNAEKMEFEWQA